MSAKLPKKAICKWDRNTLENALPLLAEQVAHATLICRKCGRAAHEKRLLCKPVRLESLRMGKDGDDS
ncbi:hypothetical protein [Allorhodopirellula heiligendammensis]|uniref:Uncharacterized protein n=1 Tax=Allorhodopirellula heiligendammensis TaxID=2714739 RepID=A0A5C6BVE1_9BACT|nr:hypothetical protein [Allorhodopirellula heiligendammensis]TWU16028.1 hypothetical protein Poly21_32330 [Allorhodopirellula heiligendammensis]